jgi:hypothetical protein
MTLAGGALPTAVAGPIFKPIAVPDGKLGIVAGNVTTRPVEVCDQLNALALPSNETEVIGAFRLLEVLASDGTVKIVPPDGMPS